MFLRIIRRLSFLIVPFLFLITTGNLIAQTRNSFKLPVTINLPADSLIKNILRLELKIGENFAFDPDQLRPYRTIEHRFVQTPLENILEKLLEGTNLEFNRVGNSIVIAPRKLNTYTIHGHIRDNSNGEEMIGATVQIPSLQVGVTTNQYGFYSISVPEGNYQLLVSYPGYQPYKKNIHLYQNVQEEIELSLLVHQLEEVTIKQSNVTPNPILLNEQNLAVKQLNNASYYAGETDVMKRLQMLNGIKSITEGSSGLFVRGGNADQNLILLDEAVVYNPSHLYGLVSVFNPDAVNNIQVYRDYMPANFGGRLSSVIVNRMAEGNSKEFHINGGLNLLSARIAAEGPLVKDKGSFIVAYRRSLLDVFHNEFKLFNPRSVYYDVNAKVNYKVDKDNSVFLSAYLGKDHLVSEDGYANDWGNLTATLRWNHIFNSRLFLNASAIYSNYSNLLDLNSDTLSEKSQWSTGVRDLTLKADYTYYRSPTNQIKFGIASTYHVFMPGEMYRQAFEFNIARDRSVESAVYYAQQINLNKSFELNYGLRVGFFYNSQEKPNIFDEQGNLVKENEISTFLNPEPRINLSYLPSPNKRIFITYNLNYQYLQLVQNSILAFSSLEPWLPASATIKPQRANQLSLGYRYAPRHFVFSAGTYYKKLDHQPELIGHAQIIRNPDVRNQIRSGRSNAYGVEMEVTRSEGRLSGTLSYSYSRVFRKIPDINDGEEFIANYDIPHELKLNARFGITEQLSVQTFFTYSTGRPLTLPVGYYQHDGLNIPIFEGRNKSRFPDFSRLDLSAEYQFKSRLSRNRTFFSTVSIGAYNLYNQKNPLYYRLNSSAIERQTPTVEYGFGFYPWIAYSFKL
ncbi:TonB-dependent receptor [Pedobacter metabolipauper]|uniref:TonB-dependent receptor-like protein n=1 Tax=Pedobacter metabolipauper TaxID=425513 RepID=A0A4R6SX78_9SPHI|nr:TonB-dependent receptor [Pedobacter metabolipauper]TDQ09244.1 TonB-dependent receptor-like protein [Pedobacter metabolipauper]